MSSTFIDFIAARPTSWWVLMLIGPLVVFWIVRLAKWLLKPFSDMDNPPPPQEPKP